MKNEIMIMASKAPVETVLKSADETHPARTEVDHAAAQGNARRSEDAQLIADALKAALKEGSVEVDGSTPATPSAAETETVAARVEADAAKKDAAKKAKTATGTASAPETRGGELAKPSTSTSTETIAKRQDRESLLTIAREEKRLRDQRKAWEAEQTKAKTERDALVNRAKLADELEALKKTPLALLDKLGIKGEEMARALLGVKDEKPKTVDEAIAAFRIEQEAKERAKEEEAKKQTAEREVKQRDEFTKWRAAELEKVKKLVEKSGEKYELVREFGAQERVLMVRDYIYKNGDDEHGYAPGNVLTLDKCAELVETLIEADQRAKAQRSKKLAAIHGKPAQEPTQATQARSSTGEKAKPAPTLSNRKATPTATPSEERRVVSDEDLLADAVAALEWAGSR